MRWWRRGGRGVGGMGRGAAGCRRSIKRGKGQYGGGGRGPDKVSAVGPM